MQEERLKKAKELVAYQVVAVHGALPEHNLHALTLPSTYSFALIKHESETICRLCIYRT